MPHKTTEKDGEKTKAATGSVPAPKKSVDAAQAAVLSELGGIFGFKKKNKGLH